VRSGPGQPLAPEQREIISRVGTTGKGTYFIPQRVPKGQKG